MGDGIVDGVNDCSVEGTKDGISVSVGQVDDTYDGIVEESEDGHVVDCTEGMGDG